jgi:hypothetical protein
VERQLLAEMDYLQKVVSHGAATFAISKVMLDFGLLAQLKRPIDII